MQGWQGMGYWKDVIERLGGGNPAAYEGHYVCADCFEDEGLKGLIEVEATAKKCTFCGASSDEPIAAPFVEILLYIKEALDREYDVAENKLPYESAEGGYIGTVWTTEEVLESHLGDLPNDEEGMLIQALCDGLGDKTWCRALPFLLTDDERLRFSWEEFCYLVKHRRHYFFLNEHHHEGTEVYGPLALLEALATWCERFGLIETLPAGSLLYRARFQKPGELLSTAADLGPPPEEKATISNRMSPPGIVMFYVSDNAETALRETAKSPATFAIGHFRTLRVARILDLAGVPPVPSIFESIPDSLEYDPRPPAIFLNYFASELSKPIARDDRVHVEYIPTQVITEYFRTEFLHEGEKIDGIRYCSARHTDHRSLVLFATQDDLVDGNRGATTEFSSTSPPWIELVNNEQRHVLADDLDAWNREAPQGIEWLW
jgi:HEPN/RES N-terminal domain 1/RES domain